MEDDTRESAWAGREGGDWAALYRDQDTAADYDRRFRGRRGRWNQNRIWHCLAKELKQLGWPELVIDAPGGTGRFTENLAAQGVTVLHLDRSAAMLQVAAGRGGKHWELVADLRHPPIERRTEAVVLCFRLMQHLDAKERVEALTGLRQMAAKAIVAYYPGWHYKDALRRWRHRLGLPHRSLRPKLRRADLIAEAERAGWRMLRLRKVLPLLSENVLLVLDSD
ncbi:MAG: class I SAM-dependent methyltransferase [Planctomycetota bacterium]|nr:MAG: class I SAM-dependent methyltransferase [Planctomycetota bacterium]